VTSIKPHLKKSGGMWECKSKDPAHAGCILLCIGRTPERAYAFWYDCYRRILADLRFETHFND